MFSRNAYRDTHQALEEEDIAPSLNNHTIDTPRLNVTKYDDY
jgi:hypothetical protein